MDGRKKDWNLYQLRVPEWQEKYMDRLLKEYCSLISDENKCSSERFWNLEKKIRNDKRNPGVFLVLKKSDMERDTAIMIKQGIIDLDALNGFSELFLANVTSFLQT